MTGEGGDVAAEIATIETTMRDAPAVYRRDEAMQGRLRDLYDAQERGAPAPAKPSGAEAERAEIERIMRTDIGRYRRDEAMQGRYRTLLEEVMDGDEDEPAEGSSGGDLAPMPTLREWTASGEDAGSYHAGAALIRSVNDVIVGAGEAAAEMESGLMALSGDARASILRELGERKPVAVEVLRADAPRRFARIRERSWRALDRMSEADAKATVRWLDNLPDAAIVAVWRKLAA